MALFAIIIQSNRKRLNMKTLSELKENYNFVYEYKNFRDKNPQKVYNHYLKRNNRVTSWSQNMVRKNRDVFKRQKEILANFVNFDIKASTATILRKYNFIDNGFKTLLDKLYFATTSKDYVALYYGDEIRYGINWLQRKGV